LTFSVLSAIITEGEGVTYSSGVETATFSIPTYTITAQINETPFKPIISLGTPSVPVLSLGTPTTPNIRISYNKPTIK